MWQFVHFWCRVGYSVPTISDAVCTTPPGDEPFATSKKLINILKIYSLQIWYNINCFNIYTHLSSEFFSPGLIGKYIYKRSVVRHLNIFSNLTHLFCYCIKTDARITYILVWNRVMLGKVTRLEDPWRGLLARWCPEECRLGFSFSFSPCAVCSVHVLEWNR